LSGGVGAIAAAGKSTPPPLEVVMPVVSRNKADVYRSQLMKISRLTSKVDVVYVQPGQEGRASPPSRISEEPAPARHPDINSRHWHGRDHVKTRWKATDQQHKANEDSIS
jgi:hypothetical protein